MILAAAVSLGGCRAAPAGKSSDSQNDLPARSDGVADAAEGAPSAAERQQRSEVGAQERAAAEERERVAAQERERLAVEERERQFAVERERVAAAERAVAEREARLQAQERALAIEKERLALERQQAELAAREAELSERERRLAERSQPELPTEPTADGAAGTASTDDTDTTDTTDATDTAGTNTADTGDIAEPADTKSNYPDEDTAAQVAAPPSDPVRERAVLVDTDSRAPAPRRVEASLEAGSVVEVEIQEPLTSRTARVGDTFSTRAARDVHNEDGQVVIPVDSTIVGRVTEVVPLRKVGGQAALGLELTELVLPDGSRVAIRASFLEQGKNKRSDKKKIAIAAAAGAVLGAILGHDAGGAAAGAAVGAAAGTAVVMTAKNQDVEISAGELIAMRLEEVVTVKTEMAGPAP